MKKIILKVTARGDTTEDLIRSLEEVIQGIRETYLSGSDRNDTGEYSFDITGVIK